MEDPRKGQTVTQCMSVYKANIQYDGSLDRLKLRTVVRGYLKNKDMIGDTCYSTASTRTMKYFLEDDPNHK